MTQQHPINLPESHYQDNAARPSSTNLALPLAKLCRILLCLARCGSLLGIKSLRISLLKALVHPWTPHFPDMIDLTKTSLDRSPCSHTIQRLTSGIFYPVNTSKAHLELRKI